MAFGRRTELSSEDEMKEWRKFQQQLMCDFVNERSALAWLFLGTLCALNAAQHRCDTDTYPWSVTLLVLLSLMVYHSLQGIVRSIGASSLGGLHEWYLCILYQILLFVFALFVITYSALVSQGEKPSNMFACGFLVILSWASAGCYLPLHWHICAISVPSMSCWILFHWWIGLLSGVQLACAVVFPLGCLYMNETIVQREWSLHKAIQSSKADCVASELSEKACRTMLNSVFDASCESDRTGTVLFASPHMQQLFGCSKDDLVGKSLLSFASSSMELARVSRMLDQVSEGALHDVIGPASRIETTILRGKFEVRLALNCVPLPAKAKCSNGRLLVGCQTVHDADRDCAAENHGIPVTVDSQTDERIELDQLLTLDSHPAHDFATLDSLSPMEESDGLTASDQNSDVEEDCTIVKPEDSISQRIVPSCSSRSWADEVDFFRPCTDIISSMSLTIPFDAGTDDFEIIGSCLFFDLFSFALQNFGLLHCLLGNMRCSFEDFVCTEVQRAPAGKPSRSSIQRHLEFAHPGHTACRLQAGRAWLEIPAFGDGARGLPVKLVLHQVCVKIHGFSETDTTSTRQVCGDSRIHPPGNRARG
eukprot:gnl/TRDRNA2_/TRDRNA2_177180_c0_seq1.p1 gnl/TRDRNA2_/TRDRNA2_177180_c0~~gnl/TRDRNA2_/TRDRNA2_177180_c0_seq1.p1  ORF type:complete len:593 (-),score=36.98 gnl/TRDRNA2_/TRDRNA2_177180_c0_seq1:405-2183(-)